MLEDLHLAQSEPLFYERMKHELPGLEHLSMTMENTGFINASRAGGLPERHSPT